MIEKRRLEGLVHQMIAAVDEIVERVADGASHIVCPCDRLRRERQAAAQLVRRRIGEDEHGGGDRTVDRRIAEHSLEVVLLDGERRLERERSGAQERDAHRSAGDRRQQIREARIQPELHDIAPQD